MKHGGESRLTHREECPECRKRGGDNRGNNLARYDDGHGYCFACGYYEPGKGGSAPDIRPYEYKRTEGKIEKTHKPIPLIKDLKYQALSRRGISERTAAFFSYGVGNFKGESVQAACYYDKKGELKAQHIRTADKRFYWAGDYKGSGLFGQQLWRGEGGKRLVITEGEIDAMTISQLQDHKWPVVSIKSGANAAIKDIKENLEWICGFETVVFAFDMDEPGRKACIECSALLPPNKAKIAWLPAKDANECMQKGLVKELLNALWEAKPYRPDGIISGEDIREACEEPPKAGMKTPYPQLDARTLGIRPGELLLFTSGSGMGKSTIVHEIAFHLHQEYRIPIGLICLEENVAKTGRRWVGMKMDMNLSLPGIKYSSQAFDNAFASTIGRGDWYAYNHFGSLDIDTLISKIRFMAVSLGVKILVLDHISIVVSGLEGDNDERKTIDLFMTRLRSLVEETGLTVLAVSHLKRPDKGKSWNEGRQIALTDLRGSGGLEQLSDIVIAIERDQQGSEPDVAEIRVLKNRYTGDCGLAGKVRYYKGTGRLLALGSTAEEHGFKSENKEEDVPF